MSLSTPPSRRSRNTIEGLARRLDEIEGLIGSTDIRRPVDTGGPGALVELVFRFADALEASQRQLIARNIQLATLREVAQDLLSARTSARAAETVALYLHKAFDYERVGVLLLAEGGGEVEGWLAARDGAAPVSQAVALARSDLPAPVEAALTTPGSRFWRPRPADPAPPGEWPRLLDPGRRNSALLVPLCSGSAPPLGVIFVGRTNPDEPLTESDRELLEPIGETLATGVENAHLYDELRDEKLFRDDLFNSMGSGLVAIDREWRSLSMNRTVTSMTGFESADVLGKRPPFLNPGDTGLRAAILGGFEGKTILRRETMIARRDGTAFPGSVSTSPLRNAQGEVYGVIATFLDMTEYKRMEARIQQLDRLAVLGRFTAAVAHEIRNPLTGISTGVEYLSRGIGADGPARESVAFILSEIRRLNGIVEDLFRATHPHPLMTAPESLEALLERAVQCLGDLPGRRGIRIERDYAPDLRPVPVDADQIQQVAINLIKNAIEATPAGGTVVVATGQRPGRRGESGYGLFRITDSGPGMNAETLKRIFEPFFTSKKEGTGLGLYISHGIVERHGGLLRADSREGTGSTFTVELPFEPLPAGGPS